SPHAIARPAATRSELQSVLCESQFHWPRTYTVTVPSPLSTASARIVFRIGLPASASAFATPAARASTSKRETTARARPAVGRNPPVRCRSTFNAASLGRETLLRLTPNSKLSLAASECFRPNVGRASRNRSPRSRDFRFVNPPIGGLGFPPTG